MVAISDEDLFAIQRDNCCALPDDWGNGVIAHLHATAFNWIVGYECCFVGQHMICGPRVGHKECSVGVASRGVTFVCLRILLKGQDCFGEINSLDTLGVS
jgi:hypothetical protein